MSSGLLDHLITHLQSDTDAPLYKQLAAGLKVAITNGKIKPGDRLPSSRVLATDLSISRTTTLNAYELLIAEGYLVSKPQSGIYVSDVISPTPAHHKTTESKKTGADSFKNEPPQVFNAGPDISQFPFTEWARILGKVWRYPDQRILRNQMPGGYPGLRDAVAGYLLKYRDIACQPEQVIITAGSRDALTLLSAALLDQNPSVTLEEPCYPIIRNGFSSRGFKIHSLPLDDEGAIPQQQHFSDLIWLTPDRHYPTGVRMSVGRRLQWLQQLHQKQGQQQSWIIEDDYDSEYKYQKTPISSLYTLAQQHLPSENPRVILCGSFSKILFSTLRIGYLVVPANLVTKFEQLQQELGIMAALPIQPALAEFIQQRKFNGHLRKMRRIYQQRRDYLYQLIQQELASSFHAELPDSGMHLVAYMNGDCCLNDTELEERLREKNIHAPALSRHYSGRGKQGLLLGFSGCDEAELSRGIAAIKQELI